MEINIRTISTYKEITVVIANATYELGLLDKTEVKQLAELFLESAQELIKDL